MEKVLQPEFTSYLEQHLHQTMFGGLFGEGWSGLRAPRIVYYSYAIISAILWITTTLVFAFFAGESASWVAFLSIIFLVLFVLESLLVERGEDAFKSWKLVLFFCTFIISLFSLGLATVIVDTYKYFQKDGQEALE